MAVKVKSRKASLNDQDESSRKRTKLSNNKSKPDVKEPESESDDDSEDDVEINNSDSDDSDSDDDDDDDSHSEDELDQSEDELDQDDEETSKSIDDEDNEEKEGGGENDENKQSSRENHIEQRKLLNERKLKRKSGNEVQQIKRIWEKLRVKNPPMPKEVRDKLCDEMWELAKDVIGDLVLKHDASRVVQTLIKYCSKERRNIVTQALKGHFYVLATSSYGKYLLIKLLHYGSKESRELILSELHGKLRKLMRHREGAYVVEDLFVLYSTASQKQQMIKEFWGSEYAFFRNAGDNKTIKDVCEDNAEKRKLIASNLFGTIKASVEKGSTGFQILHAAMKEYIQIFEKDEIREFIELLQDQIAELVHTSEGSDVACTLIALATAKERKAILKGLKPHAQALITNEHGQTVLTTIFMTVDDTVLVSKTFANEYSEKINELIINKFSRRPFIYLLNGFDKHYFSPLILKDLLRYESLSTETSKKPQLQRRKELLGSFYKIFLNSFIENSKKILNENLGSQFIQEILLNNELELTEELKELRLNALSVLIDSVKGDVSIENHLINKPFNTRLLRSIIQGGKWNNKEKKIEKLPEELGLGSQFSVKFTNEVFENDETLKQWIESPASFVVVALVDSFNENKKDSASKDFLKKLSKSKKIIKQESENENKGAQLLLKLI
ncbi:unnamed protein product [[Candida] boidinii]|uniref:Unnamed protein product n=1 Tax=Candida boidinii TaxID=5477 RepID=A0ACB5TVB8_CANBO|nr:unnamed protein product [[Candida] boidinii]